MKVENVSKDELKHLKIRRGYRHCKLQEVLLQFHDSDSPAIRINWSEENYASASSAQSSFHDAIKRLKLNMFAATYGDYIYIIKL